jgi:hypothetical protein
VNAENAVIAGNDESSKERRRFVFVTALSAITAFPAFNYCAYLTLHPYGRVTVWPTLFPASELSNATFT